MAVFRRLAAFAALILVLGGCGESPAEQRYDASALRIAYTVSSSGDLFTMNGLGVGRRSHDGAWSSDGGPRALSTPAWSPDGKQLAYFEWTTPDGLILYVDDLDGNRRAVTKPVKGRAAPDLTTSPPQGVLWSPDGERIAYRRRDANVQIIEVHGMDSRTILTRRLTSDWYGIGLVWAPDGEQLAVSINYGSEGTWITDERGRLRRFAPNGAVVGDPTWSPDGRRIAYSHVDSHGNKQIMSAPVEGGSAVLVTNDVPIEPHTHFSNHSPVWSPDGRRIAFLSNRDGFHSNELFVVGADGTGQRRLTRRADVRPVNAGFSGARNPPLRWSPDGRRVAFLAWGWYAQGRFGLVDADGGAPAELVREPLDDGYQAALDFAWRHDGEQPEVSAPTAAASARPTRIHVDPDHLPPGTVRLGRQRVLMRVEPDSHNPVYEAVLDVAPDGSAISFVTQSEPFRLGVLDLRTKTRRVLTPATGRTPWETGGRFSPDGRRLLFRRGPELRTIDRFTGRSELVTDRAGRAAFTWLADGRVAFVDAAGRLALVRPGERPSPTSVRLKEPFAYAVAPDGRRAVLIDGCRTYLVDLRSGRRTGLGVGLVPEPGSWAPDGSLLALERSGGGDEWCAPPLGKKNGELVVFDRHGREVGALLGVREPSAEGVEASWSPDSRWLVATVVYGGTRPPPTPIYVFSTASHAVSRTARRVDGWAGEVLAAPRDRVLVFRREGREATLVVSEGALG